MRARVSSGSFSSRPINARCTALRSPKRHPSDVSSLNTSIRNHQCRMHKWGGRGEGRGVGTIWGRHRTAEWSYKQEFKFKFLETNIQNNNKFRELEISWCKIFIFHVIARLTHARIEYKLPYYQKDESEEVRTGRFCNTCNGCKKVSLVPSGLLWYLNKRLHQTT